MKDEELSVIVLRSLYNNMNDSYMKSKELNKELLTLLSEIKICLDSGVEIEPSSFFHSQINLLVDKYVSLT